MKKSFNYIEELTTFLKLVIKNEKLLAAIIEVITNGYLRENSQLKTWYIKDDKYSLITPRLISFLEVSKVEALPAIVAEFNEFFKRVDNDVALQEVLLQRGINRTSVILDKPTSCKPTYWRFGVLYPPESERISSRRSPGIYLDHLAIIPAKRSPEFQISKLVCSYRYYPFGVQIIKAFFNSVVPIYLVSPFGMWNAYIPLMLPFILLKRDYNAFMHAVKNVDKNLWSVVDKEWLKEFYIQFSKLDQVRYFAQHTSVPGLWSSMPESFAKPANSTEISSISLFV